MTDVFDAAQARYDGAEPETFELHDDPGTNCPGRADHNPDDEATACTAWQRCYLCGGTVCIAHDEWEECDGYNVHEVCHHKGCPSTACEQDRYDDARINEADVRREEGY